MVSIRYCKHCRPGTVRLDLPMKSLPAASRFREAMRPILYLALEAPD